MQRGKGVCITGGTGLVRGQQAGCGGSVSCHGSSIAATEHGRDV